MIEELFREIAGYAALAMEALVVVTVVVGAVEAMARSLVKFGGENGVRDIGREIWVGFATWILLALEFALAADIIRSAIAPTWDEIGKLAAIAAIRTALNFFLARDIETINMARREARDEVQNKAKAAD